MAQDPKAIGNLADIFENDLTELEIHKGDEVRIEAKTVNDFVPAKWYFGFNIVYRQGSEEKKKSILLPTEDLDLPKLETAKKASHISRYASLAEVTQKLAEEMQRRGTNVMYSPVPFNETVFARYALLYHTTHIDFGPDAAEAHLLPHVLHPLNVPDR